MTKVFIKLCGVTRMAVVDIRPTHFSGKKESIISREFIHGDQLGAPETIVEVVDLPDGSRIERSYSASIGKSGTLFSGYLERRL